MWCESPTCRRANADAPMFLLQIEFLNSVIVDLQRKNVDLKDKLEKMAAAALNGNNPTELDNYDGWVSSRRSGRSHTLNASAKALARKQTDAVAGRAFHI